jgi:hypothetical protein
MIYLAAGAAAQLEVLLLNGTTEEGGFFLTYCIHTLKACILLLPVGLDSFFTPRNGVVERPFVQARRL